MKRIAITLGVLSILSAAHAQEATKPATDSQTPAVATPDTKNPAAPVAGANSFTEFRPRNASKPRVILASVL